jgi:acyl-coenzyme A thioesterase PaaI-like protein
MGTVNGGVLATLADMTCALALCTAFDGAMPFATSDLHIRYLEPAEGPVVVEAEVLRLSGRGAILDCRLKCGDHIVALCNTHFSIKSRSNPTHS